MEEKFEQWAMIELYGHQRIIDPDADILLKIKTRKRFINP